MFFHCQKNLPMKGSPPKALSYASMLSFSSFFSSVLPKLEMALFIARSTSVASMRNWTTSFGASCSFIKYLLADSKALQRSSKRLPKSSSSYASSLSCNGDFALFMISVTGKSSNYKERLKEIYTVKPLLWPLDQFISTTVSILNAVFGWIIRTCLPFFLFMSVSFKWNNSNRKRPLRE